MCKPLDRMLRFLVLILSGAFCSAFTEVSAQVRDGEPKAKLRFVCATGSVHPLHCQVNGQPLRPQGLPSGYRTNLIAFHPGTLQIKAEHPELGEVNLALELKSGDHQCLIFHAEPKPVPEEENTEPSTKKRKSKRKSSLKPPEKELSLFILDAAPVPPHRRFLTILQLTPQESLELGIFSTVHHIPRLHPVRDTINSQFRAITHRGKLLCQFEMMKVQEYQLILFEGDDGRLQTIHHHTR